jgi:hypothetical protein
MWAAIDGRRFDTAQRHFDRAAGLATMSGDPAILGQTGDHRAVCQAVAHAEDALARSEFNDERPLWLNAFYDQAELENLALAGYLALGDYEVAEGHAHRGPGSSTAWHAAYTIDNDRATG